MGSRRIASWAGLVVALVTPALISGCATHADFMKLKRRVRALEDPEAGGTGAPGQRERLADIAAQLQSAEQALARLEGRVEVVEHRAEEALAEAQTARAEAASRAPAGAEPGGAPPQGRRWAGERGV